MLENLREWIENLKFWENRFQNLCFWKTFHLILAHFILSMLWGVSAINWFVLFSKICFFQNFDRSNFIFDQSKLRLKTLVSLCLFRLMLDWYRFHRSIFDRSNLIFDQSKIVQIVFRIWFSRVQTYFSKSFQNFLFLYVLVRASIKLFCCFPPFILQGFSLAWPIRPSYPSKVFAKFYANRIWCLTI